ncbi:MAG: aminotransferase class III-fold pyridoxal phosphate-dependent enzyme [Deltaproteobacteria bacterium]|nr:aminotransferase class III-fold pyridoxal phosphate-dependent enzyme [Deltaproteobacteria bacterium]
MSAREQLVEEYVRAHPGSQKLHDRAVNHFAAKGATHFARVIDPFRPYVTYAKGSRKWDVDGNEYIDYIMGHGALIMGHSHPAIVEAVQKQMAKGVHFGENHELEVELAELIKELMPMSERVAFFSCGQEANMMAIRLSRVFTGRRKVLRFEENFHGWADELIREGSAGILADEVSIIPSNDLHKVEAELSTGEYAVLLTEGGGAFMNGRVPIDLDFVRALPDLTRKHNTLWVLDEIVTGFRDAPGGWQSVVGVRPDLTTLGKCVGGGLPIGAVVGRADIMEAFNPTIPLERRVVHSGTWNANPLVCSAGIAACKLYQDGEPQRRARDRADYFRKEGNKVLRERGINGRLYSRTIIHLYLGPIEFEPSDDTLPPTKDIEKIMNPETLPILNRLGLHLLQRGIAAFDRGFFVLSAAHTREDIDQTVRAFGDSLDAMIAEGTMAKELMSG